MRIALVGFGGLGRLVAEHLREDRTTFVGVAARDHQREAVRTLLGGVPVLNCGDALIGARPKLVIECASHDAFRQYAIPVLSAGIDLVAVSVGALADDDYRERVIAAATRTGASLHIPAGAIGAIDVVAAARHAGLSRVTYVSRRPPRKWMGSPAESMIDLRNVREPVLFFEDSARRAALLFSEGANVTATLAMAGVGFDETRVQLWADPTVTQSLHHIEIEGACGTLRIDLANNVGPDGKASLLTAMSIVQAVRNRVAPLKF